MRPAGHPSAVRRRSHVVSNALEPLECRRLMALPEDPEDPGNDPVPQDDHEINNSFADATQLGTTNAGSVGGTVHYFSNRLDVDYFKFTAASSTTIALQADFVHSLGDLTLTLYNGAQQQIGISDVSAINKNYEAITFAAQGGQTYYFKVGGAKSPGYSVGFGPLTAGFDWSMPRRYGSVDQFGLPVIPNTRDYAMPNPVLINGVETPRFPVQFNIGDSVPGGSVSYAWQVNGAHYSTNATGGGGTRVFDLPEGTYNVTLTASAHGVSVSTQQNITVRNYLVVAIGDSYGSGEGNPHDNARYGFAGFAERGAIWATSGDGTEATRHRMAHRSARAGASQAALALENSDPKSSVTFVFLNHTGATVHEGVLGPQASAEPDGAPGTSPAQLQRLAEIIGGRKIDTMIMSLGGNDMGFSQVLRELVTNDPAIPFHDYEGAITGILNTALEKIGVLGRERYPAVAEALRQFNIGQTILTEYPDISRDGAGNFALATLNDIFPGLEVDRHEIERAMTEVMPQLVRTMIAACRQFGWTYGDGVAAAYHTHGYGDWLRKASDSVWMQGPLGNRNAITALDMQNTWGTMHPINGGLDALRDVLVGKWNLPNLATTSFSLSSNALTHHTATYSITITNQSMRATAAASQAALYLSGNANVDRDDTNILVFSVPALGPGQSVTLTGNVPMRADPYRTNDNAVYVAPVLDWNNALPESNEHDNQVFDPSLIKSFVSDRDLQKTPGGPLLLAPTPIAAGQTINANLGIDEIISGADFDFYAINVTAGQRLDIDIDSVVGLDTHVRIYSTMFDFLLEQVASNDNGWAPGEIQINGESYLRHTFQSAGRYIIAVGHAANGGKDPGIIAGRVAGATGDYSIAITTVETVAPTVISNAFEPDHNRVRVKFSEDVRGSLSAGALELLNDSTGQRIAVEKTAYSYDAATNTATFTFPGYAKGLPSGNYRAVLRAGVVKDANGNPMAADSVGAFHVMAGDLNRDRKVDFSDLLILAQNYGQSGRGYSNGNADYSADGLVNFDDLLIVAQSYGTSLLASPAPSTTATPPAKRTSRFSDVGI